MRLPGQEKRRCIGSAELGKGEGGRPGTGTTVHHTRPGPIRRRRIEFNNGMQRTALRAAAAAGR